MKLNEIVKEVHDLAKTKGWYDTARTALETHMLIVSEVAEATEAIRKGLPARYYKTTDTPNVHKPEGEAVELADALIRIMDYFGHKGWDLEEIVREKIEFNKTRPYRHGNKVL